MSVSRRFGVLPAILSLLWASTALVAAQPPASGDPPPIAWGPHVSGVVRFMAKPPHGGGGGGSSSPASCMKPGSTNYMTNCHGTGRPVNETWITTGAASLFAGANDYNSYNGIVQDGFYWSGDGATWNDAGPIDVFPHSTYNAAGDPQLATGNGELYYSSLFFNYYRCAVGGVELLWRPTAGITPTTYTTTSWSKYQIWANGAPGFQDKPALAADPGNYQVFESWTQYASCSGNGAAVIRIAVFPTDANGVPNTSSSTILTAPGSVYSQGSSIQPDGTGGFWLTWEEYASATATSGEVMLAHWRGSGSGWAALDTAGDKSVGIAPDADLPSPLPGFNFRDNSFPVLAMVGGVPWVVWTDQVAGVGTTQLWPGGGAPIDLTGSTSSGNQFFPAIAPDGAGGAYVSFSQADGPYSSVGTGNSYDQYATDVASTGVPGPAQMVTTAPSQPNQDAFFSGGKFIGDYNGMTVFGGHSQPIWTDIRGPEPSGNGYPGWQMNAMTYTP